MIFGSPRYMPDRVCVSVCAGELGEAGKLLEEAT